MKDILKQIPIPLQKQIMHRLGYGAAVLLITVAFLIAAVDVLSILSCVAITIFCVGSSFMMFRRAIIGDYVVISGKCLSVGLTAVRKRTKMITLLTDDGQMLKVSIKQRMKRIRTGSRIVVYVATNMPVYENSNSLIIYSYLAIEKEGGEDIERGPGTA